MLTGVLHTDIFVVSDHGFSTISRGVDMVEHLRAAGFNVARKAKAALKKDAATLDKILADDWVGALPSGYRNEG